MTDETLEQPTAKDAILQAIAELSKQINGRIDDVNERIDGLNGRIDGLDGRIDDLEKSTNAQFEAIRQGLVDNSARFDRLEANFLLLRANVTELTEEIRHNRKVLA